MKTGLNSGSMQRANRNLVMRILFETKCVSRTELTKRTQLNRATITNIIHDLLEMNLIKENGIRIESNGRKTGVLCLYAPYAVILSARLTREFFSLVTFSINGDVVEEHSHPVNPNDDIASIMKDTFDAIDATIKRVGNDKILGLCLGMPGPYIRSISNVAYVPGFNQLSRIDIQQALEERYTFVAITEHDANLSALAEWHSLDQETKNKERCLISIQSIGIGIGSGIVIDDNIFRGALGIAGELGHMGVNFNGSRRGQLQPGRFEDYASTGVTYKYVLERLFEFPDSVLNESSDYADILRAYEQGDDLAVCAVHKLAWQLAYGLASIIYLINPSRIILSENYPNSARFMDTVKDALHQMVYPELFTQTYLKHSALRLDSTILGGYCLLLDNMLKTDTLMDKLMLMNTAHLKGGVSEMERA